MSYKVLARKWRPKLFDEVVAQSHVTTTLVNAIKNMRLASAYLFCGPRGVGKTTTARIFAKAINCDSGPSPTPCGDCTSCKEIAQSRSLEVLEVDGASNRGIDEVRNLRETLKYAAAPGKHRIYIIDEVHMLTTEAFNALLKTLEEPPPRVLFIFATTEPHKVPATILSRCQRYDFRRIPLQEIVAKLKQICTKENIDIDDESLYVIARKSEGSLRDGQSLLDQMVSFCGEKISYRDIAELLGIIAQEFYFECSDCVANRDVATGLQAVDKIFNQGHDLTDFLNGFTEHLRNILVVKVTGDASMLEGLEGVSSKYLEVAGVFSETDLLRLIQMCADSAVQLKRSSNPKLLLEMLFVKMTRMDKSIELEKLLARLGGMPSSGSAAPDTTSKAAAAHAGAANEAVEVKQLNRIIKTIPRPQQQAQARPESEPIPPAPEAENIDPAVAFEKIKGMWPAIVDAVKDKKIHLGSFLNEGFPAKIEAGTLEVVFGKENAFHIRNIMQNKKMIEAIILERSGFRLNLYCTKSETDVSLPGQGNNGNGHAATQSQDERPDRVDSDTPDDVLTIPLVKKVIEVFDGELVNRKGVSPS